jgi:hypothetical protein
MTASTTQRDAEAARDAVGLQIADLNQSIIVTKAANGSTTSLVTAQKALMASIGPLNTTVGAMLPEGPGTAAAAKKLAESDTGKVKVKDA